MKLKKFKILFLFIFIIVLFACKKVDLNYSNIDDVKKTNTTENTKDEISEDNQDIINLVMDKLQSENNDIIKDLVTINNNHYCIVISDNYESCKLYSVDINNNDIKLLIENDLIELHDYEKDLYIYTKENGISSVSYINNFESNTIENIFSNSNSEIAFSDNNEYFAILYNFSLKIYKNNSIIYNDKVNRNMYESDEKTMLNLEPKSSIYFSSDNRILFINYAFNDLSNMICKINLTNLNKNQYYFENYGYYEDENYKFNPDTGDILYVYGVVYPKCYYNDDEMREFDFRSYRYNSIQHKFDDNSKYLYLRNIYTKKMYCIKELDEENFNEIKYEFNENNQIVIDDKVVTGNVKDEENLAVSVIDISSHDASLKVENKITNNLSKFIKENYDVSSEVIYSIYYNDTSYLFVKILDNYIDYKGNYESGNDSLELWKYNDGYFKRLLYNNSPYYVYNMTDKNNYLMIMDTYKGYIVKSDDSDNVIYDAKFTGFSKSPSGKYTLIYNGDESFSILEDNKIIYQYSYKGVDDVNKFWSPSVMELKEYNWDEEFNKLYLLVGSGTNPVTTAYTFDFVNKEVSVSPNFQLWENSNFNKNLNYIYYRTHTTAGGGIDDYYENIYEIKKINNYIYNLRTGESFYLSDYLIYDDIKLDEKVISFNQSIGNGTQINLNIDISNYIDKNRVKVRESIKDKIISTSNNSLTKNNIELCELYKSNKTYYQIVKIDNLYYLWKYENSNFELIFENCSSLYSIERNGIVYINKDNVVYKINGSTISELCNIKANKLHITDDRKYLCIMSDSGEIKVYDENDNCIIDKTLYSSKLITKYDSETLKIDKCYTMKYDNNVFVTIRSNDMLVDVVNINFIDKSLISTGCDIDISIDNYFINTVNGYMLYQSGPSIIKINESGNLILSYEKANRSLSAINLINMEKVEIDSGDNCFYSFEIEAENSYLTYYKYIDINQTQNIYYFNPDFMSQ